MRVYLDADVLIHHLRGDKKALSFLQILLSDSTLEPCISAIQRAEIVFFMRPEEESLTFSFLSHFSCEPLDKNIVDEAGKLYRAWHKSHGVDINDCFLAATVKLTGGKLYTLNKKHYPMKDIAIEKAW